MLSRPLAIAFLVIALTAAALYGLHRFGQARFVDGRNSVLAEQSAAKDAASQQREARDQASAESGDHLQQQLEHDLPAIEGQTHADVQAIRIVYRDRPVPAAGPLCQRPDSVQARLDQAVAAANALAADGDLRPHPAPAAPPARTAPAQRR